ncbi:MAG: AgmX/PglI C-terminal domain-containing protein [Halieaceae bacterium]
MSTVVYNLELQLPWESSTEEDARFRKILRNLLSALLAFSLLMPFLPVEELSREKQEELPPHLARVVLEKKALPKPVPVPPKPKVEPKPKEEPKPEEQEKKPEPIEKPKPEPKPEPKPKPVDKVAEARKAAAVAGVLAFQDALADMRDSLDVESLNQSGLSRGQSDAESVQRAVIAGAARGGSGGIKTAALSRDTGGPALSGRETTRVESTISANAVEHAGGQSAQLGGRSDESIRRVMDRNKGAIFAVYNRALRKDPTLSGKLVFEMQIEPSGSISGLTLVSSELTDESLTKKILARIRMIRFEAESVISTRVNYSFDFLPY